MPDLHSALKTSVDAKASKNGFDFLRASLQNGKDSFQYSLHARPTMFSTAGMQRTDFLRTLGFTRQGCAFHSAEAYCGPASAETDVVAVTEAVADAFSKYEVADRHLEACGLALAQPEGWGFFYGKPSGSRHNRGHAHCRGNGHAAPKSERMKQSEDEYFYYSLTWIDGAGDKGWTTHYRPKHMPMSPEFAGALDFIGGFNIFGDCPEFDFESCWWRFREFRSQGEGPFDSNAEQAHRWFDAHAANFGPGIRNLLEAHAIVASVGLRLLPPQRSAAVQGVQRNAVNNIGSNSPGGRAAEPAPAARADGFKYDVAFSFAGTDRKTAETIAKKVRDAGFSVFYDNFYPEQLWGEDLAAMFDRIYRRESRFCVMLVSQEYKDRLWTTHERRSATARALAERGEAYILPVYVEHVDIDGLPPTLGHVSLAERSADDVADMLIRKLSANQG